jgi:hypothetical protein
MKKTTTLLICLLLVIVTNAQTQHIKGNQFYFYKWNKSTSSWQFDEKGNLNITVIIDEKQKMVTRIIDNKTTYKDKIVEIDKSNKDAAIFRCTTNDGRGISFALSNTKTRFIIFDDAKMFAYEPIKIEYKP